MTDRTPDFWVADFWDGPLSGLQIDMPDIPVTITVVLEHGRILRYEHDETVTTETRPDGTWGDVCRMVETRFPIDYDLELMGDLKRSKDPSDDT